MTSHTLSAIDYNPFSGPEIERVAPSTEPQQEIWAAWLLGGEEANLSYNESISLRLNGQLNPDAFQKALQQLVHRHESLRMTLNPDGTNLIVYKQSLSNLVIEDLSALASDKQEETLKAVLYANATTPFDLVAGPLFRQQLFKLSPTSYTLVLSIHHIVGDGWSMGTMLLDLSKLYNALLKGNGSSMEPAPRFTRYAVEQLEQTHSADYEATVSYWVEQFKDNVPVLDLPIDFPRPEIRTYKSHRYDYKLSADLVNSLKKTGSRYGASLVTTLLSAFEILMHKLTGHTDIVTGLPSAGQSATNNPGLLGHCVNLLPLRSKINATQNFADYLKERRVAVFDAYDHQQFTFGTLVKKLNVPRDLSRIPLVPVMFNIDMGMDVGVEFDGLDFSIEGNPREYESFELFMNATGSEQALVLEWSYNTQLFKQSTIEAMMRHYETILHQIVEKADTPINDLGFAKSAEVKQQARKSFKTDYPKNKTVSDLLEAQAQLNPDKIALRFLQSNYTFAQLNQKANQLASYLTLNGIRKGDLVGVAVDRSAEMLISLIAIMKAGAAYLPLDPEYPKDRVEFMLQDSGAKMLINQSKYQDHFASNAKELLIDQVWNELRKYSGTNPESLNDPNALAYTLYTSGSTGKPKGVQIEHHSLTNFLCSMQQAPGIKTEDRLLAITTISFDIAGLELYLPLISGAELVLADSETTRDGHKLIQTIRANRITVMQATPSTWRLMLDSGWDASPNLKALCGGEALSRDLADILTSKCSTVWNMYGPTETTIWSTVKQIQKGDELITIGRPIANTQVYILDENLRALLPGQVGEILIGGDGVARGYLNRKELTTEKFIVNPFSPNETDVIYRTGDLGKILENGDIQCLGRIDQQVKIRGHRIEPGEIEFVLASQEDINQAVVIAREDNPGDQRLVAYIVPQSQIEEAKEASKKDSWKQAVRNALPAYMVPNDIVILEVLPLTANGKIDRKALPKPAISKSAPIATSEVAETKFQQMVSMIWSDLLGYQVTSLHDNFFELGGHSLIAAKVMTRIEQETGKRWPLTFLFRYPTVDQLAKAIEADLEGKPKEEIVVAKAATTNNESYTIQPVGPQTEVWNVCLLTGQDINRAYNIGITLQFEGDLNIPALHQAMQALSDRHESLRAIFPENNNMLVFARKELKPEFVDISEMTAEDQQHYLSNFLKADALAPFDLINGPLVRSKLIKRSSKFHHLVITVHHIVFDGWSQGILVQELGELYTAFSTNKVPNLAPAPTFKKFAEDEERFLASEQYKRNEKFWVDLYHDNGPIVDLPLDFPRTPRRTFKSRRDDYVLNKELVAAVKKMGAKMSSSFAVTLLASFELLVHKMTGQHDITIGVPLAGQPQNNNYGLIGFCTSFLPFRSRHNENARFSDYLSSRRLEILEAYEHQQISFGNIMRKLKIPFDMSRSMLVPVIFNMDMEADLDGGVRFGNLNHKFISNKREFELAEIALDVSGTEENMIFSWSYNVALFRPETIEMFMEGFRNILEHVTSNPEIKISDLELVSTERLREKLRVWNNTRLHFPLKSLHEVLEMEAVKFDNKVAVAFGNKTISFRKLHEKSNQFARLLAEGGLRKDDKVGLAVDRSIEMVIALLAILKAGAAYIPIDPEYPKDRIEYMLENSSARLLITGKKHKGKFRSKAKEILIENAMTELSSHNSTELDLKVAPEDLAYILYTSGSTGKPKGVEVKHRNLVNFVYSMTDMLQLSADDRFLGVTTISFDISGADLYLPLFTGAALHLVDSVTAKDGIMLLNAVKKVRPTVMQVTPSSWQMLLEAGWEEDVQIRTICSSGEAISSELANKLLPRCVNLFNMYGPTETTIWSTGKLITRKNEVITIGKPIGNTRIYILNEKNNPVPENFTGEIYIAGDGVARGYHNRADLTSQKFSKECFAEVDGEMMYRTGDLGKMLPDGEIMYLGRIDHQVKIRGHRIELEEIEYCLSVQKDIKQVVVIAREDKPGDQKLVAYIVLKNHQKSGTATETWHWRRALKDLLPPYMIPSSFVLLEKLPLTPNGKIERSLLPKPDLNVAVDHNKFVGPRDETEKMLAAIWTKALGVEKISVFDEFFELGGHSLNAIQMMRELERQTGLQFPLSILFEYPTIEKLARRLYQKEIKPAKSLVAIKSSGTKMPLYIVHGVRGTIPIFNRTSEHLDPDQPIYGLQAKGLDGKDEILDGVEELASSYITEILEQNPDGPYALAGYSFGGFVAFEMAKQLQEMGKDVKLLVIFDTYAGNDDDYDSWFQRMFHSVRARVKDFQHSLKMFLSDPRGAIRYQREEVKSKLHKPYRRIRGMISGNDKDIFYYKYRIERINTIATSKYRLTPYNGKIDLFRAKKRPYYVEDKVFLGWKPFALKGIRIHEIPGEHNKIFLPPNVNELARQLQLALDNAAIEKTHSNTYIGNVNLKVV